MKHRSWRDVIPVHPAADLFPLLGDAELPELGNDIKQHGLTSPIAIKVEHGKPLLVDGRNRLDAMERVGLRVNIVKARHGWKVLAEEDGEIVDLNQEIGATTTIILGDPVEYIISANIRRRHLTADQKRDLIAKLLKATPEKSNRQIAKMVGASHPHIGKVRAELESTGDVETVTTSIDTKGCKQPASKPKSDRGSAYVAGQLGKQVRLSKSTKNDFTAAAEGLLSGLEVLEKSRPLAIAAIVQEMVDRKDTRKDIEALRDGLNRLLAMCRAQCEQAKAEATPAQHDGVMPDIPACLDRRPTSTAPKAEEGKADG